MVRNKETKADTNIMKPVISSKTNFKYKNVLKDALYMFFYISADDGKLKPFIAMDESEKNTAGYIIEVFDDGIAVDSLFSVEKKSIDKKTITKEIEKWICKWLLANKYKKFVIKND